jgi:hypothetical protein
MESLLRSPRSLTLPHAHRNGRELALRLLIKELDLDIPVTVSAIPYVDRCDDWRGYAMCFIS